MSKHKHCHCNHTLKYCRCCDTVYCTKCNKEWKNDFHNCWPNYTYTGTGTVWLNGIDGTTISTTSDTCNHCD